MKINIMNIKANNVILLVIVVFFLNSCVPPRSIINSGKVTPKGNFTAGVQVVANISTAPIKSAGELVSDNIDEMNDIINQNNDNGIELDSLDSDFLIENINGAGKCAVAYAADPIGHAYEFYARYGFADRWDGGFKYIIGSKMIALDAQYQFLGPIGLPDDITEKRWYGSVGLQYYGQRFKMPDWVLNSTRAWDVAMSTLPGNLSDLVPVQQNLNFEYKRRDLMMPLIFSRSFGNEELYGSISMGGCFNYSRLTYTTIESNLGTFIDDMGANEPLLIESAENKQNIFSFGGFVNLKLGYKYVYVLPSFAFYRQNYGNYPYLIGGETFELKGWTFVPSLGIRVRIGK